MPPRKSSQRASRGDRRPARRERSAGVVVFRDVADHAGSPRRLFLLLDYGRHWDYPKGHVEPDEDDRAAALRELHEETGISAQLVPEFSHNISYHFHSGRKGLVHKQVVFFAARAPSEEVRLSEEHVGYAWLDRDAALQQLTFENARTVLFAASDFLLERFPLKV